MLSKRSAKSAGRKPISLALQGGGAHGAFGWGVLDYLFEDGRLRPEAITGASAGAMNAVVSAAGLLEDGADGARAKLEAFWSAVARAGALYNPGRSGLWKDFAKRWGAATGSAGYAFVDALMKMTSPYDLNPLNFHPLRQILQQTVDFEALAARPPAKLFVSATNVRTGRLRVFRESELSVDALLASACLPTLFQAVHIDGQHYWDGGYTGNPALFPLFETDAPRDLVVVHLNPIASAETPTRPGDIISRLHEITFNAPLLTELRAVAVAQAAKPKTWFAWGLGKRLRSVRVHAVRADDALDDLPAGSKLDTDWKSLVKLRDRGREAARAWLDEAWPAIGARSSIDLRAELLHDASDQDGLRG